MIEDSFQDIMGLVMTINDNIPLEDSEDSEINIAEENAKREIVRDNAIEELKGISKKALFPKLDVKELIFLDTSLLPSLTPKQILNKARFKLSSSKVYKFAKLIKPPFDFDTQKKITYFLNKAAANHKFSKDFEGCYNRCVNSFNNYDKLVKILEGSKNQEDLAYLEKLNSIITS